MSEQVQVEATDLLQALEAQRNAALNEAARQGALVAALSKALAGLSKELADLKAAQNTPAG